MLSYEIFQGYHIAYPPFAELLNGACGDYYYELAPHVEVNMTA